MVFIQMHQTVTNHDAIGNDIELIGRILGENHEKMSKSKGNVVNHLSSQCILGRRLCQG